MRSSHSMLIAAALAVGSRGGSCQPAPGPPLSDGGQPAPGADAAPVPPGDSSSSGGEDAVASTDAAPEASNDVASPCDGYDVSWTPANLDFGNVREQALEQPDANVAPPSTLTVVVTGTSLGAASPQPGPTGSPCSLFGVAITSQVPPGSVAFSIQAGSANPGGGCTLPIQFAPPFNAPAGTYGATFAFGDSPSAGPLCNGPASFTATAELLAPP